MEAAWDFLSDPKNLKIITPDYMGFDIISGADRKMFSGQIIQYILTPILGIPFRWVTEITHVDQGRYFVDEQRSGKIIFRPVIEPSDSSPQFTARLLPTITICQPDLYKYVYRYRYLYILIYSYIIKMLRIKNLRAPRTRNWLLLASLRLCRPFPPPFAVPVL